MENRITFEDLFDQTCTYPDFDAQERLTRLIGLDDYKEKLTKILGLLVNPDGLISWAKKYHPDSKRILDTIFRRPPLVILAGDVGSGKTELAETIGDAVARSEKIDVTLLPMSLSTRGQGRVGEMTKLLSAAFEYTIDKAKKLKLDSSRSSGAIILLVDEADALTQSREAMQMHHEDRAGVNAFIRGVDRIANSRLPAAVIMCTNRLAALDPALKRRAAEILHFTRPNKSQRLEVLSTPLKELGFTQTQINTIVMTTGTTKDQTYGFTYSDLIQRLLPALVLDAYPEKSINPKRAVEIAKQMEPTPPFQELSS